MVGGVIMFIIPVIATDDGSISAADPAPEDAIGTITTPDGVEVYMPGDEALYGARLAELARLAAQEQQ